jgi:hypothetical protein
MTIPALFAEHMLLICGVSLNFESGVFALITNLRQKIGGLQQSPVVSYLCIHRFIGRDSVSRLWR